MVIYIEKIALKIGIIILKKQIRKKKWFIEFDEKSEENLEENSKTEGELKRKRDEDEEENLDDESLFTFLISINKHPASYKETINSKEKENWIKASDDELQSMVKNEVWEYVKRPNIDKKVRNLILQIQDGS